MRPILPFLLLGLSFTATAQEPYTPEFDPGHGFFGPCRYENPSDSMDYIRFRTSLRVEDVSGNDPEPWPTYRLLWRGSQHGGLCMVARGDGSILAEGEAVPVIGAYEWTQRFRTPEGKSCIVLMHERPCALICQRVLYYLEE